MFITHRKRKTERAIVIRTNITPLTIPNTTSNGLSVDAVCGGEPTETGQTACINETLRFTNIPSLDEHIKSYK